jgi:uncharacterized protein (DUF302 family)
MKKAILTALALLMTALPVTAADGMVTITSHFTVKETADRLEEILNKKGMTVFNRIKHSENAARQGITIRDTELIIFGNPKVGTPLMRCQQSVGIDLPLKALIWKDAQAKVWISYNDMKYLQQRHHITGCEEVLSKMNKAQAGMVKAAAME